MRNTWQRLLVLLLLVFGSFALGFYLGVRFCNTRLAELSFKLEESQNSLEIVRAVRLLEGLRGGLNDPVIERLEIQLDAAIENGATLRDYLGLPPGEAQRSLTIARGYRLKYPRTNSLHFRNVNKILGIAPTDTAPSPTPNSN